MEEQNVLEEESRGQKRVGTVRRGKIEVAVGKMKPRRHYRGALQDKKAPKGRPADVRIKQKAKKAREAQKEGRGSVKGAQYKAPSRIQGKKTRKAGEGHWGEGRKDQE